LGLVGHAKRRTGKQIQLTPRQREVVRLIAEGFSTKQIADRLGISVKTAQTHRAQLMKRLDLHDVASVVRYAIAAGLATASN
jgi:DNA-binding NarL/FixJ family response regulator